MWKQLILGLLLSIQCLAQGGGAFYGAHRIASSGPWFEGWYSRFSFFNSQKEVAVIVGSLLKEGSTFSRAGGLPGYVAVIIKEPSKPIRIFERFPERTYILDGRGEWPRHDPIFGHDPKFSWRDGLGSEMTESRMDIVFPGSFLELKANWTLGRTWSPFGPEFMLAMFRAFPLHWYVESLDAPSSVEIKTQEYSFVGAGTVHLEKNWGQSFPRKWIWIQGASRQGRLRFALAGGFSPVGGESLSERIWAFGLNSRDLQLRMTPKDTYFRSKIDPCGHRVQVEGWRHHDFFSLNLSAKRASFIGVHVPRAEGFALAAKESFSAEGTLIVRTRRQELSWDLRSSALEFGGEYQCGDVN